MTAIHQNFAASTDAEVTFEVNPDDVNFLQLEGWKKIGINRLSLGIQSFYDEDLKWMNRAHNALQAVESIKLIKASGFTNFSADLIYGAPNLTDEKWKENVKKVIDLQIPHLSCYALTVEPATALSAMIKKNIKTNVNHEQQANQFLLLMEWLNEAGYEHYEISNFALPGFRSRHNSSYWIGSSYLGIGPSAHSYFGTTRRWNISNNTLYMQAIKNNIVPFESEELTTTIQLNEYIMTALRTSEGLNIYFVEERYGEDKAKNLLHKSEKYFIDRRMKNSGSNLVLTNRGKLFADGIASDLFF
jgi:oxygen-independent coproporphyrinogen-3 oxidase